MHNLAPNSFASTGVKRSVGALDILVVTRDARPAWCSALTPAGRGFAVHFAENAEGAFRSAVDDPPDVILMDYSVPGLDGPGLTRSLRRQPRGERAPLLLVSIKKRGAEADFRASDASFVDVVLCPDDSGIRGMVVGVLDRFGEFLADLCGVGGPCDSHCHPALNVPVYRAAPQCVG